tara:strand:- start:1007 stop:1183 length:177 start_codon:yes stop_codon:yes gene_type:complete
MKFWLLLLTIILNIQHNNMFALAQTEQHSESGGGLAAGFGVFLVFVCVMIACCGKAAE